MLLILRYLSTKKSAHYRNTLKLNLLKKQYFDKKKTIIEFFQGLLLLRKK